MSKNTVEACGRIASRHGTPLMLIASRRQIGRDELGGGYVKNWATQTSANHVRGGFPSSSLLNCSDLDQIWT